MYKKIRQISEIIDTYRSELIDRDYYTKTFYTYSRICRTIQKWWEEKDLKEFNEANALRFCDEFIGTQYLNPSLTSQQKRTLRVVRMLLSIYRNEDFENCTPSIEKTFKTKLGEVFDEYTQWCTLSLKLSSNTLETHKRVALKYDIFLWERGLHIEEVSALIIEDFITSESKSNRIRSKGALRNIYRFLHNLGVTKGDLSIFILKEPHTSQGSKLPTTYTEEEIKNLISTIDRSTSIGKRNYLILLLAAEYGMRAAEVQSAMNGLRKEMQMQRILVTNIARFRNYWTAIVYCFKKQEMQRLEMILKTSFTTQLKVLETRNIPALRI